ncbi:MAG: serine/threonine-protein kinase [Ignavibacteriota bacterium]
MATPPQGEGPGPLNRPANTDFNETIQFPPSHSQTVVQAGYVLNDRYLIVRELSSGGFGKVFLAQDQQLHNRPVVVKIQLDRAIDDPWFEKKFHEELRALALIDHPGVVGALDSARTPDGRPFLVMQYVEGQSLRSVISSDGLPLDRAANIIRQIGQALGAAHEKGIWHRDLKPENIMLQVLPGGDEHVRLIDFGLATIADLAARHGTHTRIAGSPSYMAPEQFSGQPSAATDIYAFGVIAYEMVTGRKPFVAEDVMHLSVLQRSGVKLKPAALRPGISSKAEKLILHALNYNPNDRPVSASAYGDALSQALLTSQSNPTVLVAPPSKGVPLALVGGGFAVVLAAAGAIWMHYGRSEHAPAAAPAAVASAPVPATSTPAPAATPPRQATVSDDAVELAFWNSVGSSNDPRLYREYLAKYPNGKFASIARLKLQDPAAKPPESPHPPLAPPMSVIPPAPLTRLDVSALRPPVKLEDYDGPSRGNLLWAGNLGPDATLTIQGGKAVPTGFLQGDLPRVPVAVDVLGTGAVFVEQPSAANRFDRIVIRNNGSSVLHGLLIRWRVVR